jgi:TRAP-type C4-dicarboxylate transport system substrate-binding protein
MFTRIAIASGLAAVLATLAPGASAIELKYSSWTPPLAPNNRAGTIPLFEMIEKETKGTPNEITFKNFMGAQLFNSHTTLAGIRDGAVDAGVIVPQYTAAELKTQTMLGETQPFNRDGWSAAGASNEVLLLGCPQCVEDYAKNNAITLGVYGGSPFVLQCAFEPKGPSDLRGRKLAGGNPSNARFAASLGMSTIQMGPADILQALQRGTADCTLGPKEWLFGYGLKDAVKQVVDNQTFGTYSQVALMTINKNSWAKLSPERKNIIIKHMPATIARVVNVYITNDARGEKEGRERGVKFVQWGAEWTNAWQAFLKTEPTSIREAGEKRGVQQAQQLIDAQLAAYRKWEGIVDRAGGLAGMTEAKYADLLREHVYGKLVF